MQELLIFARKTDARFMSVDVAELVDVVAMAHKAWLPQNTDIILKLDEELPLLFADPSHVDRMLTNLIMNAREALPQGGRITISAEVVHFYLGVPQGEKLEEVFYLCLKVSDIGIGMDESTRAQAFEPFFTTKSLARGTGLGLSVVFGLMQVHNGFIDLQSKLGEGTTVSLFFPLPQGTKIAVERTKKIPPLKLLKEEAASNRPGVR